MSFFSKMPPERRYEILGVLMLAVTSLLFLALATDGYQGDSRRPLSGMTEVPNALGAPGASVAGFLYILVGQAAHVIYFLTCLWGMMLIRHVAVDRFPTRAGGSLLLAGSLSTLLQVNLARPSEGHFPGGAIGAFLASLIEPTFGVIGANVIAVTIAVVGILLATEFLFVRLSHGAIATLLLMIRSANEMRRRLAGALAERREQRAESRRRAAQSVQRATAVLDTNTRDDLSRIRVRPDEDAPAPLEAAAVPVECELPFDEVPDVEEDTAEESRAHNAARKPNRSPSDPSPETEQAFAETPIEEIDRPDPSSVSADARVRRLKKAVLRRRTAEAEELPADYIYPKRYTKPSLNMLNEALKTVKSDLTDSLRQMGVLLEETLETFGIEARVTDVTRGPTITRFELEPAPGVKVSRFLSLADDIALALKAHRVRVEAPIPGRGKVGIEVPNDTREEVVIRELLETRAFRSNSGPLALALGKDIAGLVVTSDLAAMPHLLIAGATGAGKTICVKTILASLLITKTPDEMQLMLIDPKMVELSIFNEIPHLITPVVIDPKKAASSLNWLINEMEERYRLFAHLRVRNIEVYNDSVENGEIEVADPDTTVSENVSVIRKLPYIVCIIDELADLMMLARAEVEDAIARLAQLARAVGIHLIIATQRPSVDVLTGVIKANFPARISFQVSSRVDSRCILDEIGAERLIGRGDMLYLPPGQSKPTRIQGAFVSDEEMSALIAYLKTQAPAQYRDEIVEFGKQEGAQDDLANETDELFDDAVRVVVDTGQASISMVQRRLRVGYTRAARLIDMMEMKGIVGPHLGSKAREILVPAQHEGDEVA